MVFILLRDNIAIATVFHPQGTQYVTVDRKKHIAC